MYILLASAAISEGFGLDGDIVVVWMCGWVVTMQGG
jgi:hypothetical protein